MAVVNPTTPGIPSDPIAAESIATGAQGTRGTLDIRTKFGAWLYARIGRTVATALTTATPPVIRIRRTHNNDNIENPTTVYDWTANVAAVNKGTLTATVTLGATTGTVTGTFAAGDVVCFSSGASRVEFNQISFVTSTTIVNFVTPAKVAHAANDTICNGADCGVIWVPTGSYEVHTDNGAGGQTIIAELKAETYDSDTIT